MLHSVPKVKGMYLPQAPSLWSGGHVSESVVQLGGRNVYTTWREKFKYKYELENIQLGKSTNTTWEKCKYNKPSKLTNAIAVDSIY